MKLIFTLDGPYSSLLWYLNLGTLALSNLASNLFFKKQKKLCPWICLKTNDGYICKLARAHDYKMAPNSLKAMDMQRASAVFQRYSKLDFLILGYKRSLRPHHNSQKAMDMQCASSVFRKYNKLDILI